MKRIHYSDVKTIARKYETAMSQALNDTGWTKERKKLIKLGIGFTESNLPLLHKDILVAEFKTLANIYVIYVKNDIGEKYPKIHKNLKKLFNYDFEKIPNPRHNEIKRFFYNHSESFGISTCHYCDMAYVNIYGGDDNISDVLSFLNSASFKAMKDVLKYTDTTINKIIKQRGTSLFLSKDDYDGRIKDRRIAYDKIEKKIIAANKYYTHFDLDHFLDKASCPIVALSVFNLVPSCTVCNQRIKHSNMLGNLDVAQLCYYSPTCDNYTFETDVKLEVETDTGLPFLDYVKNKDKCRIEFTYKGKKHYEKEVEFFRLKERYNFHKIEALRLMDLRQRYDHGGNIDEIARLIYGNDSEENKKLVRDDIFQTYFKNEYSRTFSKLYKDILSE